jgi:hypothetical protein
MNSDVKPLPRPSRETRLELIEQMKVVRSYVHLLLPRWPKENERKEIGTAVMLRAGRHLFAITAEHCVRREMTLLFPLGAGQKSRSQILRAHTRKPLDIAILELEDRPDVLACDIEQVCIDVPKPSTKDSDPTTEPLFWVVGYPSRLARVTDTTLSVPQIAFGTNLVGVKADTLALYYHEEGYGVGQNLTCEIAQLPESPHGFSGGGAWGFHTVRVGTLFNPLKHVDLYGIQYEWDKRLRLLKCVPSRVIVELLMENYPDLKEPFSGLFPPLA